MLDAFLALTILAAQGPKVIYKPDPARTVDVGTVNIEVPRRSCFGVTRASMLLSSLKADRHKVYVLSVTVADAPAPEQIQGATLGGAALRLVSVRNGDVACTEYQCPTGSAAVFELTEAQRQALLAAGTQPLAVTTTAGDRCPLSIAVDKSVVETLDAWAEALPKPAR
ncbi:MAG TPA: hypothetical protein VL460_09570 [Caulobacteraceae bacterium]|jgi:hypothetical protein|nr:hypothetical protein [Caulobacteraceae bacterium]